MAMAFDQFGEPLILNTQPRWTLAGNCGLINENGLFTGGDGDGQWLHGGGHGRRHQHRGHRCRWERRRRRNCTPSPTASWLTASRTRISVGITFLKVKTQTDSTNNRTAYLKFSLAGVSGPVTSVKFRLFGRAFGGTHMHGVYAVADTSWGETTLTFKNRPPLGMGLSATPSPPRPSTTSGTSLPTCRPVWPRAICCSPWP